MSPNGPMRQDRLFTDIKILNKKLPITRVNKPVPDLLGKITVKK